MLSFQVVCAAILCVVASGHPSSDSSVQSKTVIDKSKLKWWENGVFYQIYPRSFKDSDGDGIGDIQGIIQELDYLQELGIDGTWLSPIFKSPMADFGYDIENFYEIDPIFGTIEDLMELFVEAKKRNLKIILDFVPNHTSEKHEWFQKSIRREGKYENFYIWADGKNNNTEPPNNWVSRFYSSAWTFNEDRKQWYFHAFAKEQPDLNYRNPAVVEEMINVLKFWLEKGSSGFRVDAIDFLFEYEDLRDEPLSNLTQDPVSYNYLSHHYTQCVDELFDLIHMFRDTTDKFEYENKDAQIILMTEAYVNNTEYVKYFGNDKRKGSHIPFNFIMITDMNEESTAHYVKTILDKKIASVPKNARLNWVMGNHDRSRVGTRYGERRIDGLLTMIMTLPGIAVTYYGEEIGMLDNQMLTTFDPTNTKTSNIDPIGDSKGASRDPERTPMQWDGTKKFAGFMPENSTAMPWLPINRNYKEVNVVTQRQLPRSTLNFYKQLVQIRKRDTFAYGSYTSHVFNENVFAYMRELEGSDTYWVLINFSFYEEHIDLTKSSLGKNIPNELEIVLVSSDSCYQPGNKVRANEIVLRKYDAIILKSASVNSS